MADALRTSSRSVAVAVATGAGAFTAVAANANVVWLTCIGALLVAAAQQSLP